VWVGLEGVLVALVLRASAEARWVVERVAQATSKSSIHIPGAQSARQ
jgi:hypothetical protein